MGEEAKTENLVDAEESTDRSEELQAAEQPEQSVSEVLPKGENPDEDVANDKAKSEEAIQVSETSQTSEATKVPKTPKSPKSSKSSKPGTVKKDNLKQENATGAP